MSRYRFVHEQQAAYAVTLLCRVAGVARSASYAWARRGVSARARADAMLAPQIAAAHARSRRTYGAPRVHAERHASGVRCGRKRVARLLRAAGLVGCCRQRRPRTTVVDTTRPPAPNLVARDFAAAGPHRLWVGDSTSLPTREGWLYLAVLLAAHSRRVVGWALADHLRTALALDALALALQSRRPPPGLVHHTDRGGQYTATAYQDVLAARRLICSMRRAGECLDNAMAASFFATRKAERSGARPWATRAAARSAVFAWLEVWYNRRRRHSALAYRPPAAFEEEVLLLHDPAA